MRWTEDRIATLRAHLAEGKTIAEAGLDPAVGASKYAIHNYLRRKRQAKRFHVSSDLASRFAVAARKRETTPEAMVRTLLNILADDPSLLSNVLDDGVDA